jgi:lantibiotic modifying enzyme
VDEASLAAGNAGLALFFGYAARALGNEEHEGLAAACLGRAVEALAARPMGFGLYGGFAGIAWAVEHLQDGAEEADDDDLGEIDAALLDLLSQRPWREDYDLIGGLVGLGVYALERLPRPAAMDCLAAVVDRLAETAETGAGEAAWFTRPELLGPWARSASPAGHYNLGVAHGVPGVLALLAAACRAGVREERAAPLLEDGVRWLLARQDRGGGLSCFAATTGPGIAPAPSRLAWCYGDAGVAAALLAAARLAGRADWEREALAIAHRAAERPAAQAGVNDAGLCHGALGLGHLFNRIHQATGDGPCARAARLWYRQGLAFRRPGQGVAGFSAWNAQEGVETRWSPEKGFLTGVAGIGLALLAAASPHEPEWDRILLADVPGLLAL